MHGQAALDQGGPTTEFSPAGSVPLPASDLGGNIPDRAEDWGRAGREGLPLVGNLQLIQRWACRKPCQACSSAHCVRTFAMRSSSWHLDHFCRACQRRRKGEGHTSLGQEAQSPAPPTTSAEPPAADAPGTTSGSATTATASDPQGYGGQIFINVS